MPQDSLQVAPDRLRRCCGPADLRFQTTAEVPEFHGVIGQERALQALEFGLTVEAPGYHIFVAGHPGTGRTSTARVLVQRRAVAQPVPPDWCYAFNFDDPDQPVALQFPPGQGPQFAADITDMVRDLEAGVPRAFSSPEYEQSRASIVQTARAQIQGLLAQAEVAAAAQGFSLTMKKDEEGGGFSLDPMQQQPPAAEMQPLPGAPGQPPEAVSPAWGDKDASARAAEAQARVAGIMRQVWELEKVARERLRQLDAKLGHLTVAPVVAHLKERYREHPQVLAWLDRAEYEVVQHIQAFAAAAAQSPQGGYPLARFAINVLCTHKVQTGAPVVEEPHPTWANLFGKVEPGPGGAIEDLNVVKAGALHRANGGYLVLSVEELLKHPPTWDALKRALTGREVRIEPAPEPRPLLAGVALRPAPIPLSVKVILVGRAQVHQVLYLMDETFRKLFKVKVEFDDRMDWTAQAQDTYVSLIASFARREGLLPLSGAAVAKVLERSARMAEDQLKLSTEFHELLQMLHEANAWARQDGAMVMTADHVSRAIREKRLRAALQEDRLQEMLRRGHLMVSVDGWAKGQVNGLTVLNVGDHAFGIPSRVTCRTYMGRAGVVQIEREAEMSGKIHDKGVMALAGYLGGTYAQDIPVSITASLSFEQIYTAVDGDSASSTELYALLSALADLKVNQGLAVTGSVNQHGRIQPVGGVMYKVEGWFRTCRERGLTGGQGVIIPHQNIINLQLDEEVVAAVEEGRFHVWAVETIDQGIELLTGMPAGVPDGEGRYPTDSVHGRVQRRLRAFAEGLKEYDR